jgi:phosphopantetheinyl transferase
MGLKKSITPVVHIVNTSNLPRGGELEESELEGLGQLADHAKSDFLAGRAALKLAGREYLQKGNMPEQDRIIIRNLPDGRPSIASHDGLFCSIAHSRSWGIGAVAPRRIGVDVEWVRPYRRSLLDHVASPEEVDHVRDCFGRDIDELTIIWTIKESVMKGLGSGLSMNPGQVRITGKMHRDGIEVEVPGNGSPIWQVRSFRRGGNYFSVAYEKEHRQ